MLTEWRYLLGFFLGTITNRHSWPSALCFLDVPLWLINQHYVLYRHPNAARAKEGMLYAAGAGSAPLLQDLGNNGSGEMIL